MNNKVDKVEITLLVDAEHEEVVRNVLNRLNWVTVKDEQNSETQRKL